MFLTSLVARLWTSSMALMFRLRCGLQTGAAYLRCGRTNVSNSCLNVAQFQVLNVRPRVNSDKILHKNLVRSDVRSRARSQARLGKIFASSDIDLAMILIRFLL